MIEIVAGLLIPFLGTAGGAGCVFFMRRELDARAQRCLLGFAAGVMTAASVWSLLIPAIELSADWGGFSFFPAAAGFWGGILFLLAMDHLVPHLHSLSGEVEGPASTLTRATMLILAVTLHNIPEGMAVGVMFAAWLTGGESVTLGGAFALALGIAIQNFPEGAVISMPMRANGHSRAKSFLGGVLSGVVEPVGALAAILLAGAVSTALPYLLGFAAGAMLYVVVEELIPATAAGEHSNLGTLAFAVGFSLMMTLDVALG